jgi:hypothetical protein
MGELEAFLKDYGPAVGPALAFGFGILALIVKHKIDHWTAKWSLDRRLQNLERLVTDIGPPTYFFEGAPSSRR